MIIVKYVEDKHLKKMMFTDANSKPNWGSQTTSCGGTSRSPDLMSDAF